MAGTKAAAKPAKSTPTKAVKETKEKKKRAPSAFIIFSNEQREAVKKANPKATFGETGKLLGAQWSALSDSAKAVSGLIL